MIEKYSLIYADCPWSYFDKKNNDPSMGGITYQTMSDQELQELPVKDIMAKDSICLMWATMPKLQECLDVMKSWGFTYKTCAFVWVKSNPNSVVTKSETKGKKTPKTEFELYSGMGHYTCGNAEIILLGKRGKGIPRKTKSVKQIQIFPRGRHSAKPLEFYDLIEELFGSDVKRIELFARGEREGWDCFGNEVTNEDIRVTLNKIIEKINGDEKK